MMEIFLGPGEYFVGDADTRIRTVLGSCVSVTLWHPQLRIGAMSHFVLAERVGPEPEELDGRYAEESLALMLRDLSQQRVHPKACQAKVFGGGNMFPHHTRRLASHVGRKNGEAARRLLERYDIPIISESLFGVGHRHIIFDIKTGHVWSRQVKPTMPGSEA